MNYFTTPLVSQAIWYQIVGRCVKDEMKGIFRRKRVWNNRR